MFQCTIDAIFEPKLSGCEVSQEAQTISLETDMRLSPTDLHFFVMNPDSSCAMHHLNFIQPVPLSTSNILTSPGKRFALSMPHAPSPSHFPIYGPAQSRIIISANSLEDSKRRAKSKYDNIPDINQQYLAELNWIERKYGPDRLKNKDVVKEAQKSILYTAARKKTALPIVPPTEESEAPSPSQADLSQYKRLRNQLLGNTLFLGAIGLCVAWSFGSMKEVESFAVGLLGSVCYVYLLSRSVDRLADAARETGRQSWDSLQAARIAILVLLVVGSARNADKLSVVPVLLGFFTYKVATVTPLLTGEAFE